MIIRPFGHDDGPALLGLIQEEGSDWADYHRDFERYLLVLTRSITLLLYDDQVLLGYIRARDDDGYGIYIYDLLVKKTSRGHEYGRLLMEAIQNKYPTSVVYVMSDVDGYYQKLGYPKIGSIFTITSKK